MRENFSTSSYEINKQDVVNLDNNNNKKIKLNFSNNFNHEKKTIKSKIFKERRNSSLLSITTLDSFRKSSVFNSKIGSKNQSLIYKVDVENKVNNKKLNFNKILFENKKELRSKSNINSRSGISVGRKTN